MNLNGVPKNCAKQDRTITDIRGQVAGILIEHTGNGSEGRQQLTHQNMATLLNTGWDKIYLSLKSLNEEGAIKIDRNRIIVKMDVLQKIAGTAGNKA